ncbi:DUF4262 domain-containing protein [Saccharibacillus alkalitolerans]|uniref:DUF4262 domain-containing protein n=1 Tax=Saccharibacillus alkalitolerans TaxID=2705290 RepID=A0ABX0F8F9_9BACL|nr:DUF4262 domain-containing protein [Saccharibacillus alkalitolerans]NGZ77147.1 DUF4262 domain-containing protein [Saccharibacillus alkalitolerans]
MIETLNIPESRKQYYRTLLHENPGRNLIERYSLFCQEYTDFARRRLSYIPELMQRGWVPIVLSDEGMNYAFTIGLEYSFGHPEILIASPSRPARQLAQMIEWFAERVEFGHRFETGTDYARELRLQPDFYDLEGDAAFRTYGESDADNYPCGYLYSFYGYFADRNLDNNKLPMIILELDFPVRPAPPGGRLSSIMGAPKWNADA